MRKAILAVAILLGGCAQYKFAAGPGMDPGQFESGSAQCRLFASNQGTAVAAFGRPAFVGGAMLGAAIGNAIRQNVAYRDCMEASGWQLVQP